MREKLLKRNSAPLIIAGPCSVESRTQLIAVCTALSRDPRVQLIRCGVWKPRTRPGGFEGLGEEALEWMEEIQTSSLNSGHPLPPFCCEVARPEHVEQCLRHGISCVWIGARTSGNPFSVGELCEVFRGTALSVLVKNPLIPDVNLWIGALERVMQSGISDVGAIHRGFYSFRNTSPYRNRPLWEVPIELRRLMPELPILCDPSHIGGRRKYLQDLMQTAADLGTDGYMMEVHPHPDDAITDAQQQIVPAELIRLLNNIVWRRNAADSDLELHNLRKQIDIIDDTLLHGLSQRMAVSRAIADLKSKSGIAVYQPQRFEQMMAQRLAAAETLGLDSQFIKELLDKVHAESVRVQEEKL